ncbi:MAG: energy-coupling factor ABC transporter permease [Candidatus Hydrogenedentes bacterium]|nr:energy-coupling factor ABC transporter permease [Candidatus Hydrogenedentota bacterium]MBI3118844.1 energy-coupling factor ABC transporter permease [Candidatus Hydrogenedentota bacterium]
MHIPDGFLDIKTAATCGALALTGVGVALHTVRRTLPERRVPLVGLAAAFVFAAQMLNFPVGGGASGHLMGSVLAVVLLGPSAAVLVMTAVLVLQCFMFADGGVTALGANVFNMALVSTFTGYAVYRLLCRLGPDTPRTRLMATAFAAWSSTVAAALACAGELALSGTILWALVSPTMLGSHMFIGIGEGLITTLVVAAIARTRPELLGARQGPGQAGGYVEFTVYGLLVALGLVIFVAPFASPSPDGLERAAATLGFEQQTAATRIASPLNDYAVAGLDTTALSTILAGGIGAVVAFIFALLLARAFALPERAPSAAPPNDGPCCAP